MGLWQSLDQVQKDAWIHFIQSYQLDGKINEDVVSHNAFWDPGMMSYLREQEQKAPFHKKLFMRLMKKGHLSASQRVTIAETKQAIATLIEVNAQPLRVYRGFPLTTKSAFMHIERMDWSKPWGAGGQTSALVVFYKTQAPLLVEEENSHDLLKVCDDFFASILDTRTGTYYKGVLPEHGMLINGAMKVLTALDWIGTPIHLPQKLIDTCLEKLPQSDGCYLVDAVYVLYRCAQQTTYKRREIQEFCEQILTMIRCHYNSDGGFSYWIGRSQVSYYGVPIAKGFAESDIHATCLLCWALAMIANLLEYDLDWKIIKP